MKGLSSYILIPRRFPCLDYYVIDGQIPHDLQRIIYVAHRNICFDPMPLDIFLDSSEVTERGDIHLVI